MGEEHLVEIMKMPDDTVAIHASLQSFFNQFFIVGGMPEIVARYANYRDVVALDDVFEALLQNYRDDVEKYVNKKTVNEAVRFILTYGWEKAGEIIRLGNFANSSYASREVGEAFRLLQKAMLLELVYPTTSAVVPALPELRRMPKLIWFDTGMVNYAAQVRGEILGNIDILDLWRGRIAEQIVAQELLTLNYKIGQKRCFWSKGEGSNGAEVDFVWVVDGQLIPIEVKSGHNSKLKSLHSFIDQSTTRVAVRVWSQPLSINHVKTSFGKKDFTLINLPFYLVGDLENVVRRVIRNI
jgi:predicted AAA+ superfamily ATPase